MRFFKTLKHIEMCSSGLVFWLSLT